MDQTSGSIPVHPLLACVRDISAALDAVKDVDPDWLPPSDKGDLLLHLARLGERLSSWKLRVLAGADDLAAEHGARSPAAWLAHHTRVGTGRLVHHQALGARLADTYPATGSGFAAGDYTLDHAAAVVDSLDALPTTLDPETRAKAEAVLVGYCADYTPLQVRRLGRQVLHVLDPDTADEEDRLALEAQDRKAEETTRLTLTPLGDGRTRLTGILPDLAAGILTRALDAYTNPRRTTNGDATNGDGGTEAAGNPIIDHLDPATGHRRTLAERRGHALCALLEHLPTDGLPSTGGTPITLTVVIDWDQLRADLAAATLDDGETRLSAGQTRRLACHHGLLPVVLGGRSEVLDFGRSRRLFSHHQAAAHALTHPGCQAHGCSVPAHWCERHHLTAWTHGGPTDQDQLAFLCTYHHHRAHDPGYDHTWHGDTITYHRRT